MAQFLTESLLLTAAAAILALGLTALLLPWFNNLAGQHMALNTATLRWLLPAMAAITLVFGLFSGAYPAFFLSAFRPVQVLKGKLALGGKGSGLRNVLVVGQFTISIFLIVGALVVYRQLHFIQHRDPGYSRSQVLVLKDLGGIPNPDVLKQRILTIPGVAAASRTDFLPTGGQRWHNWGTVQSGEQKYSVQTELWLVDRDYIPTMDMHLVTGRNFSPDYATDTNGIVINEAAARMFGIAGDPLNKIIRYPGYLHGPADFTVIGVVKDFNYSSIRTAVQPLVLVDRPADIPPGLVVRIRAGHVPDVLAQIKAQVAAYAPEKPFEYSFMDDDFDAVYASEQRMGIVVTILTALAIVIACLGLFGLAAYAAEQRAREIGIRKILGAGIPSILALLSKDFARLLVLAMAIATPVAGWAMYRWLENFAYRTSIPIWLFAAAAGITLLAAAATTLFQSLKAATANPVETLRSN
jgi:putative ABC transport system permease protein